MKSKNQSAIFLILAIVILAGCMNPIPMQRTESSTVKTADSLASQNAVLVERTIHGEKTPALPPLTVSGASNTVEITYHPNPNPYTEKTSVDSNSDQSASASSDQSWTSTQKLPLGIALTGIGIGLFSILYAFKSIRRSSATAGAAFDAGDDFAANFIQRARQKILDLTAAGRHSRQPAPRANSPRPNHTGANSEPADNPRRHHEKGVHTDFQFLVGSSGFMGTGVIVEVWL